MLCDAFENHLLEKSLNHFGELSFKAWWPGAIWSLAKVKFYIVALVIPLIALAGTVVFWRRGRHYFPRVILIRVPLLIAVSLVLLAVLGVAGPTTFQNLMVTTHPMQLILVTALILLILSTCDRMARVIWDVAEIRFGVPPAFEPEPEAQHANGPVIHPVQPLPYPFGKWTWQALFLVPLVAVAGCSYQGTGGLYLVPLYIGMGVVLLLMLRTRSLNAATFAIKLIDLLETCFNFRPKALRELTQTEQKFSEARTYRQNLLQDLDSFEKLSNLELSRYAGRVIQKLLGPGYTYSDKDTRIRPAHLWLLVQFFIVLGVYLTLYLVLDPEDKYVDSFPPLGYLLVFLFLQVSFFSGLAFILDRYRIPLILGLVIFLSISFYAGKVDYTFHLSRSYTAQMPPDPTDAWQARRELQAASPPDSLAPTTPSSRWFVLPVAASRLRPGLDWSWKSCAVIPSTERPWPTHSLLFRPRPAAA